MLEEEFGDGPLAVVDFVSVTASCKVLPPQVIQLTFTCSNSTIETRKKGVKYVQS